MSGTVKTSQFYGKHFIFKMKKLVRQKKKKIKLQQTKLYHLYNARIFHLQIRIFIKVKSDQDASSELSLNFVNRIAGTLSGHLTSPIPKPSKTKRKIKTQHIISKLFSNFTTYFILGKDLENIIKLLNKLQEVIRRKTHRTVSKATGCLFRTTQLSQQSNRMIHN